jgi:glycerol kinase
MTENPTFVQALADAAQRPVEISPVLEATTVGSALMAGLAVGHHAHVDDLAATWSPRARIEPRDALDRDRWREAVDRSRGWIPELSGIDL